LSRVNISLPITLALRVFQFSARLAGDTFRILIGGASLSKPAKQNQDQNDDDHKTQSAATVIARPVERTAAYTAKSSKQNNNQDDKQNGSD
jgi:hypothetical protein